MYFNSHTHLNHDRFHQDRSAVIDRMRQAGVDRAIVVGCDVASSRLALQIATQHDFLHASAGVHPHDAKAATAEDFVAIEAMLSDPNVVALGETGLDFYYDLSPRDIQERVFRCQLEIAVAKHMPVIIHTREAIPETVRILKEYAGRLVGGVVHCFQGGSEFASAVMDMGFYLGVTGIVTYSSSLELQATVTMAPLERLLIETDCPYLTPAPLKKKTSRNEPGYVGLVAEEIARLKGVDLAEVARLTYQNTCHVFRINQEK
jgi:TatD DNase family protein